jgi:hypothetical protein
MMKPLTLTLELGGYTVQVQGRAREGDPGRTYGPPEDCYEGWPPEFDVHSIELVVPVTEDLSPNPRETRLIHVKIDDLLDDIPGASEGIGQLIDEAFANYEPNEPEPSDE